MAKQKKVSQVLQNHQFPLTIWRLGHCSLAGTTSPKPCLSNLPWWTMPADDSIKTSCYSQLFPDSAGGWRLWRRWLSDERWQRIVTTLIAVKRRLKSTISVFHTPKIHRWKSAYFRYNRTDIREVRRIRYREIVYSYQKIRREKLGTWTYKEEVKNATCFTRMLVKRRLQSN